MFSISGIFFILFLILLVAAIRIVVKIVQQQPCPTYGELQRTILFRKEFNDPKGERIIAHLGSCKKCQALVDEINGMPLKSDSKD